MGRPSARRRSTSAARARSAALPGSACRAKRALLWVYSWPQHTSVSGGKAASLRREANISAAVPSSSRPQPKLNKVSPHSNTGAAPGPPSNAKAM